MKLAQLKPDTRNANKGTARGRKVVRESLRKYGAGRSILLDKSGNIIAGNKTVEGAKAIGLDDVQIVKSDGTKLVAVQRTDLDINDPKARELAIADNRASELGLDWDMDVLKELKAEDVDLSPFWDERELVQFWARVEAPEPKLDNSAELSQKWNVERGQIWKIGKHSLMCGDCLADQEVLLRGEKVELVLTDPPYGVGVHYGAFHDNAANVAAIIEPLMKLLLQFPVVLLTPGIPAMWLYPKPTWLLAWVHPAPTSSGPWGFNGLNPVLAYGGDPYLKAGLGRQPDSLILATDRKGVTGHPTPKPQEVWKWLMERGSIRTTGSVYDPFSGSGTSLVVAEQTGRTCYAMEIEPKYVAVALERLSDMGLKPELSNA